MTPTISRAVLIMLRLSGASRFSVSKRTTVRRVSSCLRGETFQVEVLPTAGATPASRGAASASRGQLNAEKRLDRDAVLVLRRVHLLRVFSVLGDRDGLARTGPSNDRHGPLLFSRRYLQGRVLGSPSHNPRFFSDAVSRCSRSSTSGSTRASASSVELNSRANGANMKAATCWHLNGKEPRMALDITSLQPSITLVAE